MDSLEDLLHYFEGGGLCWVFDRCGKRWHLLMYMGRLDASMYVARPAYSKGESPDTSTRVRVGVRVYGFRRSRIDIRANCRPYVNCIDLFRTHRVLRLLMAASLLILEYWPSIGGLSRVRLQTWFLTAQRCLLRYRLCTHHSLQTVTCYARTILAHVSSPDLRNVLCSVSPYRGRSRF
jgi:hypothetical protein